MKSCYIITIYKNFVRFISDYEQPIQFFRKPILVLTLDPKLESLPPK